MSSQHRGTKTESRRPAKDQELQVEEERIAPAGVIVDRRNVRNQP